MSKRGLHYLLAFAAFIIAVGLACSGPAPAPTPVPTSTALLPSSAPQPAPTEPSVDAAGSDLITFTDQNDYYQIDLPADWEHKTSSGQHYYRDTFTSPDGGAVVENYVYDDGTPWSGKDSGKYALDVLNKLYSKTGAEGDIRISEEKKQDDGSDRLTWSSKKGGYSGISFFETRGTAFLMFTVNWGNEYKDQYLDVLDQVVASYRAP